MQIVNYPHPALRWESSDVTRIDDKLRATIQEMFHLMYAAKGIGLAANQVGLPLRFFIVNLSGDADNTDEELVFINPDIKNRRGQEEGEEGCLSLPGLYADVKRAGRNRRGGITTSTDNNSGQRLMNSPPALFCTNPITSTEFLFIDRIDESKLGELQPRLDDFASALHRSKGVGRD